MLAVLFASCVAVVAGAGTITGTIRSAETHEPLAAKVAAAYDTAGTLRGSATSDSTGTYVLTLPAGGYRLLAYDPNGVYATMFDANAESFETSPVTTIGASDTVRRDFSLVRGGTIKGVVTAGAMPLAAMVVEAYNLSGTRRGFTETTALGTYSIVLPPGSYKLVAYDPSGAYSFSFYRDVRAFSEAVPLSVTAGQATDGVNFSLGVAARIVGTVVDAANSLPLAGINVYAYTRAGALVATTTTDALGAFRFSVPAGEYRVAAGDPSRTLAPGYFGSNAFETSTVISLTPGTQRSNVQLRLTRGAKIAGRVRDAAGLPVANVTAAAYNLDGTLHATATTDATGAYELLVAAATYKLAVFDPQLVYATRFMGGARDFASIGTLGVMAGQRISGFDFTLIRGGRVSGTVRELGEPREGIAAGAYDAAGLLVATAITNANGSYAFVVPPGDYRLVAFDPQLRYAPSYDLGAASFDQTVPRIIAAGAAVTADFTLRRGIVVSGDVVDQNGTGISGANVFALDAAGNRVAGAVTVNGAFSLAVPAGTYRFVVRDSRYAITWQDQVVTETHPPRLIFVLEQVLRRRAARH